MGWDHVYKPGNEGIKEFFEKEFSDRGLKVLGCEVVDGDTAYLAIEYVKTLNLPVVSAMVCCLDFTQNPEYNFGWKEVPEDALPVRNECPEHLLNLLTPLEENEKNSSAIKWRLECWDQVIKRKVLK